MTWAQFLALARPWRWPMAITACLMLIEALFVLSLPWVGGQLAGRLLTAQPGGALVGALIGLIVVVATLRMTVALVAGRISVEMLARLRTDMHDHLQSLPVPFHEGHQRGDLLALTTWEVGRLSNFLTGTLVSLPPMLLTAIGSISLMFFIDPVLALCLPVLVPIFYLVLRIIGRRLRQIAVRAQEAEAEALGLAEMHLEILPAIKSFNREGHASADYGQAVARARDIGLAEVRISAILNPAIQLVASVAAVLLLVLAGRETADMTAAELVSFLMYAALLTRPVSALSGVYGEVQSLKGMLERLGRVLGTPSERDAPDAVPLAQARGQVTFDRVAFAYPGRAGTLNDVTIDIPAGQTLALTGANGAGKSTLVNLLLRFIVPGAGAVRLDGIPVDTLRLADLRARIGVVPQRPLLFDGTVAENIGFGRADAGQDRIEEAARLAQAHDFITALPDGYTTRIGGQGVRLSGGQGQRVALARALIKDPAILILDEATSMFDTEGEADFVADAAAALRARTVILITHRPATLALADRVVVLADGRIVSDDMVLSDTGT